MKRSLIAFLMFAALGWAQEGAPMNPTAGPPQRPWSKLLFYDGSDNLTYICYGLPTNATVTWTIAATTLTNVVVSSNVGTATTATAHGLTVGAKVILSGWTVDAQLNATFEVQTVPSTTSFTITTASVSDATYTDAKGVITSTSMQDTGAYWAIQRIWYSATNYVVKSGWAEGTSSATHICANRASLTYR